MREGLMVAVLMIIGAIIAIGSLVSGKTITVDGSGNGDFSTISDAVRNADDGDIIRVRSGLYKENIEIENKSLHLIGEGDPKIEGKENGYILWLTNVKNFSISGFTIRNSKGNEFSCIRIEDSVNVSIFNCNIENSSGADGLMLIGCESTKIGGCIVKNNKRGNGIQLMSSNNNTITENRIIDNQNGITIYASSYNRITANLIDNDGYGIRIISLSHDNVISENVFSNNDPNAYDTSSNYWYDPVKKKGNYWDDYKGKDSNHDGIGDTPYQIPGGKNNDNYVLGFFVQEESQPRNQKPIADAGGEYHGTVNSSITFDASRSYDPDGIILDYIWDFGDGGRAKGKIVRHSYSLPGNYTVTLTVRDDDGAEDSDTSVAHISLNIENRYPTPIIDSRDFAKIRERVEFNASKSYDPDGEILNYIWRFGDGKVAYGRVVEHSYNEPGDYEVTLEVIDDLGYRNSTRKTITIFPEGEELKADFSLETDLFFVGSKIFFNASKSTGNIISYIWEFGDGKNLTTTSPICNHTYLKPGIYQVNLTIVGLYGEISTKSKTVVIEGAWKKGTPGFGFVMVILSFIIVYVVRRR